MNVSRSAFYAYRNGQSHVPGQWETQAVEQLLASFEEHRSRYGSRRLVPELCDKGFQVGRHRLRRWMRDNSLEALQPRSFVPRTTDSRHTRKPSPNLLMEDGFEVKRPNQVLVGDITYLPLKNGKWAYLATWLDLFSRKLVGWHIDLHMRAEIVDKALQNAENRRNLAPGLIVHSDRGSQYASGLFRKHLLSKDYRQSMSRKGDSYDNAFAESFFSRLKAELPQGRVFEDLEDARTQIFEYIECYYNPKRRHSSLKNTSPDNFEKMFFSNLK